MTDYYSISKMAQNISQLLYRKVKISEIQQILKQLNCLDTYNYPTTIALGCKWCKMRNDYRGKEYATWSEEIEREVYEILLENK